MGAGEDTTPTKPSKPTSSAQEMPTTPSYPEWSSSMQAYYGPGATPPPFFAPSVASPTPHPYLWGSQHPLIPPYGTPVPYSALYPPGGVYAHPNLATAPSAAHLNPELEGKGPEGKDKASAKKSKGTSGNTVKGGESGKAASGSGNDGASPSAESGSEGSSDASDENTNQQDERELKRQKRKQSNRESARRSRLRKQAECEELQAKVETLSTENTALRDELQRLSEECEKLTSENNSIKEELTRVCGADAVAANLKEKNPTQLQSQGVEGNS